VIVVRRIGTLDDPKLFRPWCFRIASREAFRHIRKRRLWLGRHQDDPQLDDLPTPETRLSGELLRELLATDTISPASRAVLILHFEEELSLPEVAAILDIPLGTAKSRLAYGLRSIRKHLDATGGSHG
jgi:RNA polymerase sigma-70 factor (ECF subfamily)